MNAKSPRRGYAMVLVLVFIALLLTFYSVAYRQIAAALRVDKARMIQRQFDEGALRALARGLALLETGEPLPSPPAVDDFYECGTTIETSGGQQHFTVKFTFLGVESGKNKWKVTATPDESSIPMPTTFPY